MILACSWYSSFINGRQKSTNYHQPLAILLSSFGLLFHLYTFSAYTLTLSFVPSSQHQKCRKTRKEKSPSSLLSPLRPLRTIRLTRKKGRIYARTIAYTVYSYSQKHTQLYPQACDPTDKRRKNLASFVLAKETFYPSSPPHC